MLRISCFLWPKIRYDKFTSNYKRFSLPARPNRSHTAAAAYVGDAATANDAVAVASYTVLAL